MTSSPVMHYSLSLRRPAWLLLALLFAAACGGGASGPAGAFSGPADLEGRTVGVASLAGTSALELRYLLHAAYGLEAKPDGGDVALLESPADSLILLLGEGGIDAAAVDGLAAYRLSQDDRFVVLAGVAAEVRDLTGGPTIGSVLVSYPDVAAQKAQALTEVNRMLAASITYLRANKGSVIDAVADAQAADPAYLRWWWDRQELALGDLSPERQEQIRNVWEAARTVGDVEGYPEGEDAPFGVDAASGTTDRSAVVEGNRLTISLALLDDPSRRAALYAIEQGIVTSELVDLSLTYLPESQLGEAPAARQYDVIEASPLVVPLGAARGLDFVVLSAGLADLDGTLLFVRRAGS